MLQFELKLSKTKINYLRSMNNWLSKFAVFVLLGFFFTACGEEISEEETTQNNQKKEPVEAIAKRFIESKLEILPSEKYKLEIFKSQLDGDNSEDAVITVNRYQFAVEKSSSIEKSW